LLAIDDGAKTFEDSLRFTQGTSGFGVTEIITTPHIQHVWDNTSWNNQNKNTTVLN
jgi:tyrosine-protein phosphatase YwqE